MRVLELSCSNGLAGQDLSTTDGQPEAPGDGPRLHLPADCHGLARYCRGTATPTTRLYNVRADPREQSDLAAAMPELVAEMRARLDAVELEVSRAGSGRSRQPALKRRRGAGGGVKQPAEQEGRGVRDAADAFARRRVDRALRVPGRRGRPQRLSGRGHASVLPGRGRVGGWYLPFRGAAHTHHPTRVPPFPPYQ